MASLLETFYIMFESNSDKVKKGNEDIRRSSKDAEESLGRTDRQAQAMGEHLVSTLKNVAAGFAAAFAVREIEHAIVGQAELNAQLGLTAKRLNVNIEDLGAWSEAALRSGGTTEGFASSLDFLNKNMAAVEAGAVSRVKPYFKEMKIAMVDAHNKVRPLFDILGDLADRFSKMGAQEVAGFGEKLGLDSGTILMLQSGRRAVEDLVDRQRALGVTSKEDAEAAHKFMMQMQDLSQTFHHLYTTIGTYILPTFTAVAHGIENIVEYLAKHKTLVEGFFVGVAGAITVFYLPAMIEAAIATIAATWPFLLIGLAVVALIAAFALLYDDVMNFLDGNNSVIGELSKKWPWIGAVVRGVVKDVAEIFEWAYDVIKGEVDLMIAAFELAAAAIGAAGRLMTDGWRTTTDFISGRVDALVKKIPMLSGAFGTVGQAFKSIGKGIVAVFDWILDKAGKLGVLFHSIANGLHSVTATLSGVDVGRAALATAGHASLGAMTSNSIANSSRGGDRSVRVDVGGVKIDAPGADGAKIGQTVGDHLETHLRQAVNHFDDGVRS